jgi:hypothetical protein
MFGRREMERNIEALRELVAQVSARVEETEIVTGVKPAPSVTPPDEYFMLSLWGAHQRSRTLLAPRLARVEENLALLMDALGMERQDSSERIVRKKKARR